MATKNQIKKFMLAHWEDHLDDSRCLNMTTMAEDAAGHFGDDYIGRDKGIPEEYFECALAVKERLQKARQINS